MKKIFLLIAVVLLSACGQKIEGTYTNEVSGRSLIFQSNGMVIEMSKNGKKVDETAYSIDGDSIKIGPFPLTITKDGWLDGGSTLGRWDKK